MTVGLLLPLSSASFAKRQDPRGTRPIHQMTELRDFPPASSPGPVSALPAAADSPRLTAPPATAQPIRPEDAMGMENMTRADCRETVLEVSAISPAAFELKPPPYTAAAAADDPPDYRLVDNITLGNHTPPWLPRRLPTISPPITPRSLSSNQRSRRSSAHSQYSLDYDDSLGEPIKFCTLIFVIFLVIFFAGLVSGTISFFENSVRHQNATAARPPSIMAWRTYPGGRSVSYAAAARRMPFVTPRRATPESLQRKRAEKQRYHFQIGRF